MAFYETRFPLDVALGFTGGPERRSELVALASGREERNQRWAGSRRRYNAASGVKQLDDLQAIFDFFEMAAGRVHGFRLRDWADWKSCAPQQTPGPFDQLLEATADPLEWRLAKTYGKAGFREWRRMIRKPVAGTVAVSVAGAPLASGWTVEATTGLVTFTAPPATAPRAGFEFDVPVRFDTDGPLFIDLRKFDEETGHAVGEIGDIPLVEDLNA